MYTVTFLNNKGGVGKTVTVTALGHILAQEYKKKVLLVDMDPQANTSQFFGIDSSEEGSLKEILEEDVYPIKNTVEDILWDTKKDIHECIYETDYAGLDIIPSFITLSNMENQLIIDITEPNQFRLYKQLAKVDKEYDYCLIDCGPSVSLLNANALAASDVVYIPSRCDRNSRIGIANVLRLVHNVQDYSRKELRFGGCFLTQYDSRKKICQEAVKDCGDAFGKLFLPITIPVCTKMEQASSARKPILEIEPKGNATRSYLELAELLVQESKDR